MLESQKNADIMAARDLAARKINGMAEEPAKRRAEDMENAQRHAARIPQAMPGRAGGGH